MKGRVTWVRTVLLFVFLVVISCNGRGPGRPKLVVYVVVDQLRGDLLERYDSLFTEGFRRLHDDGFRFLSTTHDHGKTATAAGHATLSTGVFPSRSGIVNNDWLERGPDGWHSVYSVEDTLTHILGRPALEGRSPKNLLRGGIADWISQADSGSIVVSASRKDRAAITMAGKTRGHVYWMPGEDGRFVTSSFYAADYPTWVDRINREDLPVIFGDSVWEQTVPEAWRALSRADTAEYEGDGIHTAFPHRFEEETGDRERPGALKRWAQNQHYPDAALAVFATEAVTSLGLGQDLVTDYLGLSFSQADWIGHDYGPLSREQLETLLQLDRLLGELMDHLDREVGEGRWVMALSGDHGALTIPEYLGEEGKEGSRARSEDFRQLRGIFQSFRDEEGDSQDVADSLVSTLERLPFIADALSVLELTTPPPADSFVVLMRNSFHPGRWIGTSGNQGSGVVFRYVENYYPSTARRGTGHGTPYYYDRHVPLIFYGEGVDAGISTDPVRTVDIAPTLADLAGISWPDDLDGQPVLK